MNFKRFLFVILIVSGLFLPAMAIDSSDQINSALILYSKSVDRAYAGNYAEALQISDQALALNVTSMVCLIQAHRAGILGKLGRFEEANAAADASLAREGKVTTAHSIAWYNKGTALLSLGRLEEAKTAFAKAAELDPTLIPPDLSSVPPTPMPQATKSPISWFFTPLAIAFICLVYGVYCGKREKYILAVPNRCIRVQPMGASATQP